MRGIALGADADESADAQARGIAYDDSASDCRDNLELTRVLAPADTVLQRPLDLVGMDACLMTRLEVASSSVSTRASWSARRTSSRKTAGRMT